MGNCLWGHVARNRLWRARCACPRLMDRNALVGSTIPTELGLMISLSYMYAYVQLLPAIALAAVGSVALCDSTVCTDFSQAHLNDFRQPCLLLPCPARAPLLP